MIGALNPVPFRVGGGPTPTSKAYQTIRKAVGEGGSAPNDLGIEGLWRRSEAKGLAAGASHLRRALLQRFPHLASDFLPSYERALGIVPPVGANDEERRKPVVERYTRQPLRNWTDLESALKAIDARFSLRIIDDAIEVVTEPGRGFEAYPTAPAPDGPPFGIAGGCSQYPLYSTRQVLRVRFNADYPTTDPPTPNQLTAEDGRLLERARKLLVDSLPSDMDFLISTETWRLGQTPLGLGELG